MFGFFGKNKAKQNRLQSANNTIAQKDAYILQLEESFKRQKEINDLFKENNEMLRKRVDELQNLNMQLLSEQLDTLKVSLSEQETRLENLLKKA
jgi:hypothetical protein